MLTTLLKDTVEKVYSMKWYVKLCILLPFIRGIHFDSWNQLSESWPDYTYWELWFYFTSILLENALFYSVSKLLNCPLIFLLALMSFGEMFVQSSTPFEYSAIAVVWRALIILITCINLFKLHKL